MGSSDLDSQSSSAHALAALSDARDVTAALTRPAVLTSLVALLHLPEPEAACRLIACVADKPRAARVLLDGGAAASLLGLLGPALGRSARYAVDLLNAVQRLLEAATPAERDAAAELEMGMHRLHQIFVDISSMVERQGGVVESVEAHVARSAACVESGAAALDDARALRAKRRRRTMVAVAIAAGVLAVVAMLVLAGFAR